ncbi:MAG: acetylxylan esterase [Planctomycetes bacterium]|nr:acetylxylan esterase [Planctomycetota bacterium]
MWDMRALGEVPEIFPAPGFAEDDLEPIFYRGPDWKGKETRVFAWIGIPENTGGDKLPAMVLVHGGSGTAYPEWVRLWNSRGYAAIAMDTCGCYTGGEPSNRPRHEHGGPPGWGGHGQIGDAPEDQWMYHAVASTILGHSILRARDEVDENRIGITGVSWGGVITSNAVGIDKRFKFAAPVYGCGFLGSESVSLCINQKMPEAELARWMELWDPSNRLKDAELPMLWVNGTNDFAFSFDAYKKSYRLPKGERTLSLHHELLHDQETGSKSAEVHAYADHLLKGKPALCYITKESARAGLIELEYGGEVPLMRAEICYTEDSGKWQERKWNKEMAHFNADARRAWGEFPSDTTAAFLNLIDDRGMTVSSEIYEF